MTSRFCWALALGLLTASTALAQAPRGRDAGDDFGDEAQGERGERGDREFGRDGQQERRFGRGGPEGEEGGRGGFGRGGFGMRRVNPMFAALDADGDGAISKTELRKAAAALAKLDADGDGSITQEEASGPAGPGGMMGGMGDPNQMIDMAMRADANGDGKLTADEIPDARMRMMMQNSDLDGDGGISREELAASMEQMRQRMMGGGPGFGGPGGARGGFGRGGDETTGRLMSLDKNGDGKITTDEATPEARPMLRQADANGDGEVDAREMAEFSRRMGGRARGALGGAGQAGPRDRFGRGEEGVDNRRSGRGRDDAEE